ncbi:MAG: hypothetical protein WCW44_06020, partial [archaeon]
LNMTCVSKKDWVKKEDKKTSSSSVVSTGVKKEPKVKKESKPKVAKAKVEKQSDTKSIKVNEVK